MVRRRALAGGFRAAAHFRTIGEALCLLTRTLSSFAVFHLRRRSLLRGGLLVLGSLAVSFRLAGFPNNRANAFLIVPATLAFFGTFDTIRCLQPRWGFYHAGVILCLFMDLIAMCLILFFLFFPYVI
jgi:hypothetical protein